MKLTRLVFATILTLFFITSAPTFAAGDFNPEQKKQIEKIVHEYLVTNPEILNDMFATLQNRKLKAMQEATTSGVAKYAAKLFNDSNSPTVGNLKGKVTVVEFLDYQCVHCRRMAKPVDNLLKSNKDLRVIFKAVSFFGPRSTFAAEAVIAAQKQNKSYELHMALLDSGKQLTKAHVLNAAKKVGINTKKLQAEMKDKAVIDEVKQNEVLAKALGIRGTPSFIVSDPTIPSSEASQKDKEVVFLPGEVPQTKLQKAINKVKQG